MEDGILNQTNDVPIYHYEKLSVELIERVMKEYEDEYKRGNHFVFSTFGTVEQVSKAMKQINDGIEQQIKSFGEL